MGNIKIKLASTKKINNVNIYSDVDVESKYMSETLYDRNAVKASLNNILTWKPYERILNPSFGNTLWMNLFENIGKMSRKDIITAVREMLSHEPRINVDDLQVTTDAAAHEVAISFSYTIPELDNVKEQYELTISK